MFLIWDHIPELPASKPVMGKPASLLSTEIRVRTRKWVSASL